MSATYVLDMYYCSAFSPYHCHLDIDCLKYVTKNCIIYISGNIMAFQHRMATILYLVITFYFRIQFSTSSVLSVYHPTLYSAEICKDCSTQTFMD